MRLNLLQRTDGYALSGLIISFFQRIGGWKQPSPPYPFIFTCGIYSRVGILLKTIVNSFYYRVAFFHFIKHDVHTFSSGEILEIILVIFFQTGEYFSEKGCYLKFEIKHNGRVFAQISLTMIFRNIKKKLTKSIFLESINSRCK